VIYLELDDIAGIVLDLDTDALIRVTDLGLADSAVSRPNASFDGQEFYPTIAGVAAGTISLDELTAWIATRIEGFEGS
jgi:hypothetical protein